MRLYGQITRWDDERGFGFISRNEDGSSVFVHIKAFSGTSRRPDVGDIVSYEVAKGENGKSRAENVCFLGESQPKPPSTREAKSGAFPVVFTALFVCFVLVSAYFGRISWLIVVTYVAASLVTFVAYGWDKSSARLGNWRTPESTLHTMGLFGGWPGGLAAQRLLRHKSSKQDFQSTFWVTVFVNVLALGYLVWRGEAGFMIQWITSLWQNAA